MTTSAICSCNSLPSAREHFRNVLIHDFHGRNAILMLVGLSIVFTASVLMVLITRRTFGTSSSQRRSYWSLASDASWFGPPHRGTT